MADWRSLLRNVLLADDVIDADEVALLKAGIMDDGVVDDDEFSFLVDLRNDARECSPEFLAFFFSALKSNILEDGVIDSAEAARLREVLYADGVIDEDEKTFLRDLKAEARQCSPEFLALFEECMKS